VLSASKQMKTGRRYAFAPCIVNAKAFGVDVSLVWLHERRIMRGEEKIWELQQSKAQTIADVLGEEGFARSLTKTDLECLFSEG
jgi:hypothetical protein